MGGLLSHSADSCYAFGCVYKKQIKSSANEASPPGCSYEYFQEDALLTHWFREDRTYFKDLSCGNGFNMNRFHCSITICACYQLLWMLHHFHHCNHCRQLHLDSDWDWYTHTISRQSSSLPPTCTHHLFAIFNRLVFMEQNCVVVGWYQLYWIPLRRILISGTWGVQIISITADKIKSYE